MISTLTPEQRARELECVRERVAAFEPGQLDASIAEARVGLDVALREAQAAHAAAIAGLDALPAQVAAGDLDGAVRTLHEVCEREFEFTGDCEFVGPVSELFDPHGIL